MSFLTRLPRDRYRSDAFAAFKDARSFDLGTGRALIWLSQLAYETKDQGKIQDILTSWNLKLAGIVSKEVTTVLPVASTHCILVAAPGIVFVAFAGTDPLVLANWITDFDAIISKETGIADGYGAAAAAVLSEVRKLIPANAKVYVTGHSLGGALAAITAYRLAADSNSQVEAVYTFGMPRPGDQAFADNYNSLLGQRTFRLVHGDDLVPTVAPTELKFRHLGRYLHCEREGKFDPGRLAADVSSDEPSFDRSAVADVEELFRHPVSRGLAWAKRLGLAAELAVGLGPADMRHDPGGIAIELLPSRLRDHMPDRYIGGF